MKKQIATAVVATLLTTTAAPAFANDAVRIGVGILGLVINEATKGGKGGNRGPRNKGDVNLGPVGGKQSNNSSRNRNKVAPAVAGGAVAATAFLLPEGEAAPIPLTKPTAEEMAVYIASLDTSSPISSDQDGAEIAAADEIPMTDEQGRFWGNVTAEQAEKIARAEKEFGMKLSVAIPAITGMTEPQASVQVADTKPAEFPIVGGADMAAQGKPEAVKYGTFWNRDRTKGTLVDEQGNAWGDETAAVIAQIDKATDGGMIRSEAIRQFSRFGEPGRTHEEVAAVKREQEAAEAKRVADAEAFQRQVAEDQARADAEIAARKAEIERQRKADIAAREKTLADQEAARKAEIAEAKRRAEEEALLGSAPAVDQTATTASVTETAEEKPVAIQPTAKKPKLDL